MQQCRRSLLLVTKHVNKNQIQTAKIHQSCVTLSACPGMVAVNLLWYDAPWQICNTHTCIHIYIRMYAVCWYLFIHISYLNMYTDLFSLQMESCHWNKESKVGRLRMFFCATGMKVNTAMHYACIKIGSDVNHFNRTPWYPYYTWGFPDRTADGAGPGTICLLDVGGQNRTTDRSRSLSLRESLENVLNIHSTVLRM